MFMLKSSMELKEIDRLRDHIDELEDKVSELKLEKKELKRDLELAERKEQWEIEKVKNDIRKDMQKRLIESDLKRTEAIAKLNTYIDMDTKDEKKHIQEMLEEAIKALGKQKITINSK